MVVYAKRAITWEFIEEVRSVYDVILFDSPPVLQATDATVLGTRMDGVLLVYMMLQRPEGLAPSARRSRELHGDELKQDVWLDKSQEGED